jgi:hypothetical protein
MECEPCARVSPGLICDFKNHTSFELIHTMDLDLRNNSEGAAQLPLREQLLEDREVAAIDSNEVEVAMTTRSLPRMKKMECYRNVVVVWLLNQK